MANPNIYGLEDSVKIHQTIEDRVKIFLTKSGFPRDYTVPDEHAIMNVMKRSGILEIESHERYAGKPARVVLYNDDPNNYSNKFTVSDKRHISKVPSIPIRVGYRHPGLGVLALVVAQDDPNYNLVCYFVDE